MCCRRRNNDRRRQPLVLGLGFYAYRKFQERKGDRAVLAALTDSQDPHPPSRRVSPPLGEREPEARAEILEKAGLAPPPSYDVATRGRGEREGRSTGKLAGSGVSEGDGEISDAESLIVADGRGDKGGKGE